jgi:hypothetical protein
MRLCFLLLFASLAWGLEPELNVDVHVLHPDADLSPMEGPNVQVHRGIPEAPRSQSQALPHPTERDRLFAEAGLKKEIQNMDDFDRDMLYRYAHQLSLEDLIRRYPAIQVKRLRALQVVLRGNQ